jgi:hypothetical protein
MHKGALVSERKQVNIEPIIDLLRKVAPDKSKQLDKLIEELKPHLELDYDEERILFRADCSTNAIIVGVKCTCRLHAHSYAYAIIYSAIGTPNYLNLTPDEHKQLFAPAYALLNWVVGNDLLQWTKGTEGIDSILHGIFGENSSNVPKNILSNLTNEQITLGEGFFRYSLSFIILHELAHLKFRHITCNDIISIQQEKEADQFAAEWLIDSAQNILSKRMASLNGIAIALIWLTVRDIFLGQQPIIRRPPGYDRLFQVLNQVVDNNTNEEEVLFLSLSYILFLHIDSAGIEIDLTQLQGTQKERVNYMINIISKKNSGKA